VSVENSSLAFAKALSGYCSVLVLSSAHISSLYRGLESRGSGSGSGGRSGGRESLSLASAVLAGASLGVTEDSIVAAGHSVSVVLLGPLVAVAVPDSASAVAFATFLGTDLALASVVVQFASDDSSLASAVLSGASLGVSEDSIVAANGLLSLEVLLGPVLSVTVPDSASASAVAAFLGTDSASSVDLSLGSSLRSSLGSPCGPSSSASTGSTPVLG